MNKITKKENKINIDSFVECIPDEQLIAVMGKREYNRFSKWMRGQTVPLGGVYKEDLERYLNNWGIID